MTDLARLEYQLLRFPSAAHKLWTIGKTQARTGGKKGRVLILVGLPLGRCSLSWLGHYIGLLRYLPM